MESDKPHVELVRTIAEALCEHPDQIEISDSLDERGVLIMLYVSKEDLPRLIGKGGETASAIRMILRVLGARHNARYAFKVNSKPY